MLPPVKSGETGHELDAMRKMMKQGKLIIISGPSGAGKSTVVRQVLRQCPLPLVLSVSATTRAPRRGERDGVDYHFLTLTEFARRRANDEFLECKEVFGCGDWYGTLRREVTSGLAEGKWVVLEIDVEGTLAVLENYPDAVTFFVRPSSLEELERRLRTRGTESDESIRRRLEVAQRELTFVHRYQHQVINDDKDQAVRDLCEALMRNGDRIDAR
jgi:guanylate kinase